MAMGRYDTVSGSTTLIRWGAVFGGVVLGFSALVLLTLLWLALASSGAEADFVTRNLRWFLTGSAVGATFLGGLIAGWLSGVPKASAGAFNGLTVWGLILIAALAVGVPGVARAVGFDPQLVTASQAQAQAAGLLGSNGDVLWATLIAALVGALAAGLGGAIGGALTSPPVVTEGPVAVARREDEHGTRTVDRPVERDEHRHEHEHDGRAVRPSDQERTVDLRDDERTRS